MFVRIPLFVLLSCLVLAGPVAAPAQTFGLEDGRPALASRMHADWVKQASQLPGERM